MGNIIDEKFYEFICENSEGNSEEQITIFEYVKNNESEINSFYGMYLSNIIFIKGNFTPTDYIKCEDYILRFILNNRNAVLKYYHEMHQSLFIQKKIQLLCFLNCQSLNLY